MTCEYCDTWDGASVYPWYGRAPHDVFGQVMPREQWGDNFQEDPDAEGLGTYTHCLFCTPANVIMKEPK